MTRPDFIRSRLSLAEEQALTARAEAAERLLEEVVGVLDDHRVITHVGPDQGDSGPLVKLSPAERLREALTKARAISEGRGAPVLTAGASDEDA